jgi:hypothetical protein
MDGIINQNEVESKRITVSTTVPNNDVAKLMYYLSCVCTTIIYDEDEDIRRFINYANWAQLSVEEQKVLLNLCYTFSPDVVEDKVFFHNRELCVQFDNEFYEINQVRQQLNTPESIIIADRTYQVTKIMTYKMSWMQKNYLEPIQRLSKQFASQSS